MLGIDHQHGRHRGYEPGADSGVPGWQRRGAVCRPAARRGVRLGREDAGTAPVHELGQARQGIGPAIPFADDGTEPSAGHALDWAQTPHGAGESGCLPADQVRHALHGCRRQSARLRRQGPRKLKRTGAGRYPGAAPDAPNPRLGVQRLRASSVYAGGVDLGGAPLPAAEQLGLPEAQHQLSTHAADADSNRRAAQTATARRTGFLAHRHRASGLSTREANFKGRRRQITRQQSPQSFTDVFGPRPRLSRDEAERRHPSSRILPVSWQVLSLALARIADNSCHDSWYNPTLLS